MRKGWIILSAYLLFFFIAYIIVSLSNERYIINKSSKNIENFNKESVKLFKDLDVDLHILPQNGDN